MTPHRILYIHHGQGISGATLSLLYLIEQLDRARYEPVVACLYEGASAERFRQAGIETRIVPGIDHFAHTAGAWLPLRRLDAIAQKTLHFWPSVRRTETLVAETGADLVHVNSAVLAASAWGAHRAGVPVVWHIREPLHPGHTGLRRAILRRLIHRYGDRVVPVCQQNAALLLPSDRIRVVYNFVDFTTFDRSLSGAGVRQSLGIPTDAPLALMLGGVSIIKGTVTYARALSLLLERLPDAHFLVAGYVPEIQGGLAGRISRQQGYTRALYSLMDEHDLHDRLHLLGLRDDVPQLLAASDVLVFPSTVPHFARPVAEAGAMARPVVASDLGGPREIVQHGETGLLVPPRDPAALADALLAILSDRDRARAMGEAGYRQARRLFDARINAPATIALYDELLNNAS